SALFLHEPLTFNLLAGLLFIVISICFVNSKPKKLKAANPLGIKGKAAQ
ncbi:EamA family transporter, partial [Bacillus atrophaeus]|nr:EamA family transporter [Bacillus atrophaeus]